MIETRADAWRRFCDGLAAHAELGIALDVSRADLEPSWLEQMGPAIAAALEAMAQLEAGAIANPDEHRAVGHYWLRAPALAPTEAIGEAIRASVAAIRVFAHRVHDGEIRGQVGAFRHVLHIGVGGSALGPQLLADALGGPDDRMRPRFIDNTDPDGLDEVLASLRDELGRTLVTVVSKSGSTPEPRNGMLEVKAAYERAGLDFAQHAVAVTMEGSALDVLAEEERWVQRFPIWDWVGGRTSIFSAVGLLPAALMGLPVHNLLAGAAAMDRWTREADPRRNPAALLALAWYRLGDGRGRRDMVVLPYKDRLLLLGRYLQQLVMESLGKAVDRAGTAVHQGLTVYGNKGSTDQHAFVQQLREGPADFFATFLAVLHDREGQSPEVEPGVTSGDYLLGFLLGTREALGEAGRRSITIALDRLTPRTLGATIALYERAVGLYAELIDVNAYDQPGVEAGKKAAARVLDLQRRAVAHLRGAGAAQGAAEVARALDAPEQAETVYWILRHLAANGRHAIDVTPGATPEETRFAARGRAGPP